MSDVNSGTASKDSKALVAKRSLGMVASQTDPAELEALVLQRRDALFSLADDSSMPEEARQAVRNLAALASPTKPGLEEVVTAWKIPRISIAQPTSRSTAKPENAKNGDLYTSAGQLLERPWGGIPLYFYEEHINYGDNGSNPVCSAPDGKLGSPFGECAKCPHLPFGKQNAGRGDQRQTSCQNNIVCVMLAHDLSQVYTVQFGKTSRRAGSALLSLAGQQTAVWRQSYLLNTEKKAGDRGVYWIYKVEATGKDNADHVQRLAEALYGLYIAERKKNLADWYSRPAKASIVAIEAEGEFQGGALEAGLSGDGVEPDLSAPVVTPTKSARTSAKPM